MSDVIEAALLFVCVLGHGMMLGAVLAGPLERRLSRANEGLLDAKERYITALEGHAKAKDKHIEALRLRVETLTGQTKHMPMHTVN